MEHQEYYIIRGDRSGVFFGQIVERKDREVTLTNCRRVWYWDGAASLSQLAAEGVKAPQSCRIAMPVEELTGSCLMGREQFARKHEVDLEASMTVREFIKLTENAYGGSTIRKLKEFYS